MFNNFFFSENRAVYEIMWKNVVERGRSQMTIWRMRITCWMTKDTFTHSEYVIHVAFPLQQWLHERVPKLRCMYITLPVSFNVLPEVPHTVHACMLLTGLLCPQNVWSSHSIHPRTDIEKRVSDAENHLRFTRIISSCKGVYSNAQ